MIVFSWQISKELASKSVEIAQNPYSAGCWAGRADLLATLEYPEVRNAKGFQFLLRTKLANILDSLVSCWRCEESSKALDCNVG